MLPGIYALDLMGTFAFAVYGSFIALNKRFDIFGVFVAAFLSGLGGGTIREIMLRGTPPYFSNFAYVLVIVLAVVFSVFFFNHFHVINRYLLIVDAVGLSTFAYIGAASAQEAGVHGFGIIFFATITAVGGGLLRDVVLREVPQILYRDFYASAAIFLGLIYSLFWHLFTTPASIFLLLLVTFALRMGAIYLNVHLWIPHKK